MHYSSDSEPFPMSIYGLLVFSVSEYWVARHLTSSTVFSPHLVPHFRTVLRRLTNTAPTPRTEYRTVLILAGNQLQKPSVS
jgi:hypothetical protein